MFTSTKQQILFTIFAIFAMFAQVQGAAASAGNVIAGLVIAGMSLQCVFVSHDLAAGYIFLSVHSSSPL
jgi:hypothetical protein